MKTLTHITDVGAASGDGTDSTERIRNQYNALGVEPRIVTAGQSPLHVAFAACTDVAPRARNNVCKILTKLGLPLNPLPPTALNSAPRNAPESLSEAKEDHIYRLRYPDGKTFLIYGPQVLSWVLTFRGRTNLALEKVLDIADIIPDTSVGSQFRSAEHLPIVHWLHAIGKLDENSKRTTVDANEVDRLGPSSDSVTILPPDEFKNGRLLLGEDLFNEISTRDSISLPEILNGCRIAVRPSLTDVVPYKQTGEFSVWPSSNHFPDASHRVLNLGTRWSEGQTTAEQDVSVFIARLSKQVGRDVNVSLE